MTRASLSADDILLATEAYDLIVAYRLRHPLPESTDREIEVVAPERSA